MELRFRMFLRQFEEIKKRTILQKNRNGDRPPMSLSASVCHGAEVPVHVDTADRLGG